MSKNIDKKYYETMEERLLKVELSLMKSKIVPPSLQKLVDHPEQDTSQLNLFQTYILVLSKWTQLLNNRDEPILSSLNNKYNQAILKSSTNLLELNETVDLVDSIRIGCMDYQTKLQLLLNQVNQFNLGCKSLEVCFGLEANLNPPQFKEYVKYMDGLYSIVDILTHPHLQTKTNAKKTALLIEAYNLWVNGVTEIIFYLKDTINKLNRSLDGIKQAKPTN